MLENNNQVEIAVFGGGCFWCTEAVYKELKGVLKVEPGYAGGTVPNPTYTAVSSGSTGHAEVIKVEFNPQEISYRDLLEVFFATHNPTTLNQQGADIGTQYRSAIFYTTEDQKNQALGIIKELEDDHAYEKRIVTEIVPLTDFYKAEDYHLDYYRKNKGAPYCQLVIEPKLIKFQQKFSSLIKEESNPK